MRIFRDEVIPEHVERHLDKVYCDLCKAEITKSPSSIATEITLHYKKGQTFEGCNSGVEINYDCCDDCFNSEVIPFLESKGAVTALTQWKDD